MKKLTSIILILFFSLLSSPSWSENLSIDDLVERDGIYYKKFTDVPFTGEITGQGKRSIKDGLKEGVWVSYHNNGQLFQKGEYKNGKKEGVWVFYQDNGLLMSKGEFKDGKEEGEYVSYWSNGQFMSKGGWKNGERVG